MSSEQREEYVRRIARGFRLRVEVVSGDLRTRWWEWPRIAWWTVDAGFAALERGLRYPFRRRG
jgi:hypothetical protein